MTHLLGNIRKIDRKCFKAVSSHSTKKIAKERAKSLRNKGHEVRILPSKSKKYGKEYYIWSR